MAIPPSNASKKRDRDDREAKGKGTRYASLRTATYTSSYSPYGQRPRRSGALVALWMFCFVSIVAATWYIRTRHADAARGYAARLMRSRGDGDDST